ncbi:hypothetical protein [Reyranella sp.]|uniref:hypothetical protein n=1 Tax=Reyranella sp. TaxID=1929291 RepID=UPI003D0CCB24
MKKVILAVVILAAASACTVRSERTVVEKPTPVPANAVVVTDPPPSTVYVPAR